jgi:hypothetical protein
MIVIIKLINILMLFVANKQYLNNDMLFVQW